MGRARNDHGGGGGKGGLEENDALLWSGGGDRTLVLVVLMEIIIEVDSMAEWGSVPMGYHLFSRTVGVDDRKTNTIEMIGCVILCV